MAGASEGLELIETISREEATQVEVVGTAASSSVVSYEIDDGSSISLERNASGHTVLHLAAARGIQTISDVVESCTASEARVRLREQTGEEGWTSLHISTIKNDAEVVKYILNKFRQGEERRQFIDEVDRMGWTSLHWGAALDKVEAVETTLEHTTEDHLLQQMTGNWTLLHTSAKRDAVKVMESLMKRVRADGERKWKILTCPTGDGQTALHIAVAEGNTRTAILLLDLAGERKGQLLSARDNEGQTASDCSSQFPLLGEYLRLSTAVDDLVLHAAARNDDRLMVSWMLEEVGGERKLEMINKKNANGLTALQVASEANSAAVIKEMANILTEEEFIKCIAECTVDGDTALHIAAINGSPSSLHALLASASHDKRKQLLTSTNLAQQTVMNIAQERQHQLATDILKHHETILTEGLKKFFYVLPNSLFSIELSPDRVKAKYERIEPRQLHDRGLVRHINYDATSCLLYEDIEKAAELIALSVKINGDSIHTWCNKGVLELHNEQPSAAEQAAFRVLELIAEDSVVCQSRTKIEFAYYLAEVERTEEARDQCCQIMQSCWSKIGDNVDMQESLSYYLVKILVRQVRSDHRFGKPPQWIQEKLNAAVEQLVIFSKSKNEERKADMWLWLAELQNTNINPDHLELPLKVFSREAEISNINRETCLNRAYKIQDKLQHESKTRLRIARLCLDCARTRTLTEEWKLHWFEKAIEQSENWTQNNYWTFMAASTCAHALIQIWAMKFYPENMELVSEHYERLYERQIEYPQQAWEYLSRDFYSPDVNLDRSTIKYLGQAKEHLQRIVDAPEGWISHGVNYSRVKFLLGEPREYVKKGFWEALSQCDKPIKRVKTLQHFGSFWMSIREYGYAQFMFQMALQELGQADAGGFIPIVARKGLAWIAGLNRRPGYQRRETRQLDGYGYHQQHPSTQSRYSQHTRMSHDRHGVHTSSSHPRMPAPHYQHHRIPHFQQQMPPHSNPVHQGSYPRRPIFRPQSQSSIRPGPRHQTSHGQPENYWPRSSGCPNKRKF